jgi:hypothetical protein
MYRKHSSSAAANIIFWNSKSTLYPCRCTSCPTCARIASTKKRTQASCGRAGNGTSRLTKSDRREGAASASPPRRTLKTRQATTLRSQTKHKESLGSLLPNMTMKMHLESSLRLRKVCYKLTVALERLPGSQEGAAQE